MDTPLSEAALQELVMRSQNGDTKAFGKIYDHFFTSMYRYTALRVPSEVAEDLVADIFVQAWEKIHTYRLQKNVPFGAWLFRIARHKVIDAYRAHQGWEEVPEETEDPDILNRAETAVQRQETLGIVRRALAQLPRRYRDVLHLSFFADLSHGEVAKVMRLTEGAVRILKFRALRKLESHLPADMREPQAVSVPAV